MNMPDYIDPIYYDPLIEEPTFDDLIIEGLLHYGLPANDPHPPPTEDPKPEHVDYRDEGCEVAPRCLSCPLPSCRYDSPALFRQEARHKRDRDILAASREHGLKAKTIAQQFGLSQSMVHRILKESNAAYSAPSPVIPASDRALSAPRREALEA